MLWFSSEIFLVAAMANNAQFSGMQVVHLKDNFYMSQCLTYYRAFVPMVLFVLLMA